MRVEAIHTGFYGDCLREPGARFDLQQEQHFSKHWMRRLPDGAPLTVSAEAPPIADEPQSFVDFVEKPKAPKAKGSKKDKKSEEPTGNADVI